MKKNGFTLMEMLIVLAILVFLSVVTFTAFATKLRMPNANIAVIEQGNFIPYHYGTSTRSAACTRQQWGQPHKADGGIP